MAIRRELRKFYGPAWRAYRKALIGRLGFRCVVCGSDTPRWLNLAHVTHDPRSSSVARMCPACHSRHDAPHRLAVWRRNHAKRYGQLWLFPELEWDPFPAWMLPRELRAPSTQERLF